MGRFFLFAAVFWANIGVSGASPLALPVSGNAVTVYFTGPEAEKFADLRVIEVNAAGKNLRRIDCTLEEHALAYPERGVYRAVRFTPAAGQKMRYYRFEADSGGGGNFRADGRIFPTGNFEDGGWWFGDQNPVLSYRDAAGRGGGKALEVNLTSGNTGKPVVASSRPGTLMQLTKPEIFPVLMRGFVRLEAGEGAGVTLRLRRFDADKKYAGDYGGALSLLGGAPGEWRETRLWLEQPLAADTAMLEVFLVNLAPRDGVRFLVDAIEFLPVRKVAPPVEFTAPDKTALYAGKELRFAVHGTGMKPGIIPVREEMVSVQVRGREEKLAALIAGFGAAAIDGAEFSVELQDAAGKTVSQERVTVSDNAAEIALTTEAGDYRAVLTLTAPDGTTMKRTLNCPVSEDPFAE